MIRYSAALLLAAAFVAPAGAAADKPADKVADRPAATAADTDPVALGWMQGFPPPRDKQVRAQNGDYYVFPKTRWAFSHMRQLLPTLNVWRGAGPATPLPYALRDDLDKVTFTPADGSNERISWREALDLHHVDAIIILHRGHIIYEKYFGATTEHTPHMSYSMTKSYTGTLAAIMVDRGILDRNKRVSAYLPALADSGFGDATVGQVMDMTTSLAHSENYDEPGSALLGLAYATGILPVPPDYPGPDTIYSFLPTIDKQGEHGEKFSYKSVNTEVVGWLLGQTTGKGVEQLLSEEIWQKLGAEMDAYIVSDLAGIAAASGGLSATLRDQARFGEMLRLDGFYNGQQIVPRNVVDDIRKGGDRAKFAKADVSTLPGWSYRNQWWVSHNANGAFSARGIHGQTIYIDPQAEMVIVRFASFPKGASANMDPTSLPAYQAIADHLMANGTAGAVPQK